VAAAGSNRKSCNGEESQSRGPEVGFGEIARYDLLQARFWPTFGWPTIRELVATGAFLGADPEDEPVTSVLPTGALAQDATNGFGLASLNAMPQQSNIM
jgi:hypothetical protein